MNNMKLSEINWAETPTVKCPVWAYAPNGNDVVKKTKELYPASAIGIGGCADFAISIDDAEWLDMSLWQKIGERYIPHPCHINKVVDLGTLRKFLETNTSCGLEGWKKVLDEMMGHGAFIKSVWLMPLAAGEKVKYEQYRAEYRRKKDEAREAERKAEEEKRATYEAEEEAKRKAELDKAIENAIAKIENGGAIINKDGTLIIELARRAGIKVPLRSDGWMRKWLHVLYVKNGKTESVDIYRIGGKRTKVSDSMWATLNEIVAAYYKKGDDANG